jgi:hypothetical protein
LGKIIGLEESVKATVDLGYPENLVSTIGFILFIVTILYAIPRTSILGAILLTAYLGGAVATHFRIESPIFSHTLFPVYLAIIAWLALLMRNGNIVPFLMNKKRIRI